MIIVLILISIIFIIISLLKDWDEEFQTMFAFGFLIKLGVVVFLCIKLINFRVIDDQIKLYENQNKEIEAKVSLVVKEYMQHESNTFKDLNNNESYIVLVTLYPELKSDELIKQEIELYKSNNEKITSLKEKRLKKTIYRWWLYFGK